ncbi:MAG TPA: hypothetical protein VMM18_01020 [Gemmatimonadaceae bacterium]|nr:hypothetical protein [Gemmatimonadaceae bacterium]
MLLLVLVDKVVLLRMAVGPLFGVRSSAELLVVVWVWLLVLLGTVAGLTFQRRWGAYLLLIFVPVSTVLLSIPLIPWITQLAPQSYRVYGMLLVNGVVLFTALLLVQGHRRRSQATRPAG